LKEETEGSLSRDAVAFMDVPAIREKFPEVTDINDTFLADGIFLVVIAVKKNRENHIRELSDGIFTNDLAVNIKFLLFLDSSADIHSPSDIAWIAANNIDPERDCFHPVSGKGIPLPVLVLDGTRKITGIDGFSRDWPNIIVMNDSTICKIDENWKKYGLGPFISSPSLKYRRLILNDGAVVKEGF
jgi:4-hydroxy-3-polyprenylbenzoate decarboxylase